MRVEKKYRYKAFGLFIESEISLPELIPVRSKPEIFISYAKVPENLPNPLKKGVLFQASENQLLLRIKGIAAYYIEDGCKITIEKEESTDEKSVRIFLLGPVLGGLLMQRGLMPIHGSSVKFNNNCIIFSGNSGAGKSTLAAGFMKQGHYVLNDDISVVKIENGKAVVIPGFPQLKLWADVLKKFNDDPENFRKLRDNIDKHAVSLKNKFYNKELPVKKIFILTTKNTPGFNIEKISGIDKFNVLKKNTFRFQFIDGLAKQKEHFTTISSLAGCTEVYKVSRPRKGFQLDKLIEIIKKYSD